MPALVESDGADERRVRAESAQVPRDVEGCSAEHARAVGELVEQDFAEDDGAPPSTGNPVAADGRRTLELLSRGDRTAPVVRGPSRTLTGPSSLSW
jgi:hypothetical protein